MEHRDLRTGIAGMRIGHIARRWCCFVFSRRLRHAFGAVSQSMVLDAFPKEQHGTVTAIYGMGVIVGPIVGPVISGYLNEAYNWRWVFFMILPFTALALAGSWPLSTKVRRARKVGLDRFVRPRCRHRLSAAHVGPRATARLV